MPLDPRDLERIAAERWGAANPVAFARDALAQAMSAVNERFQVLESSAYETRSRVPPATPIDPTDGNNPPTPAGGLDVSIVGRPVWIAGQTVIVEGATVTVPRPGDLIVRTPISISNRAQVYPTGGPIQDLVSVEGEVGSGTFLTMLAGLDYTADLAAGTVTVLDTPNTRAARRFVVTARWAAGEWTAAIVARVDGTVEAIRGATSRPDETLVEAGLDADAGVLLAAVVGVTNTTTTITPTMIDAARGEFIGHTTKFAHRLGSPDRNRMRGGMRYQAEGSAEKMIVGLGSGDSGPRIEVVRTGSAPALTVRRIVDSEDRFQVLADGSIAMGGGATPPEIVIERDEAGVIRTNATIIADGGLYPVYARLMFFGRM